MFSSPIISQLIPLHDQSWLENQVIAGKCVSECLKQSRELILSHPEKLTGKAIESLCLSIMSKHQCKPTFFGYKGFPAAICLSINNELVHGIPKDKPFQEGDVIKVDLGATYNSAIADAAITVIYGTPKISRHVELIKTCHQALQKGIEAVQVGKRIGAIGEAIHQSTRHSGFNLITNYGGHGLAENCPHASPFIPNKAKKEDGPRIHTGMTLAIEPMVVIGDNRTRVSKNDQWTVLTDGVGVHFEHTIFVSEKEVFNLTAWENDAI